MPIITLTSDLGNRSHYTAIVKGVIYAAFSDVKIVDITHEIPSFDIMEAAYMVKNTYKAFPKGSIHLIAVDPEYGDAKTGIVMFFDGHYFISPDNGVCSLICENAAHECILISAALNAYPRSFRAAGVLAPAAAAIAVGKSLSEIGHPHAMKELYWGAPSFSKNSLRGKIIHIDKFGNAITNIDKTTFLEAKKDSPFQIILRSLRIRRIVSTYSDVPKSDALAIFGQTGYLEIAMREASAADLFGLKVHDMITIEFEKEKILPLKKKTKK